MQNVDRPISRTNGVDTVSWQDEQRKLQEQYDRGEISAQEFRTRRDSLFAAASAAGQGPQPPHSTDSMDATQTMRPVPASQPPSQEPTQTVRPVPADPDRTQVVAGGGPQQGQFGQSGGFPTAPGQGGQQQADEPPPWAGAEFPPLTAPGTTDWSGGQPDFFAKSKRKSGAARRIIGAAVAVVVLLGLGAGGYFLWGTGGNSRAERGGAAASGAQTSAPVTPATVAKPRSVFPVGDMPVEPAVRKDVTSVADFPKLNYFTDAEQSAYETSGARKAKVAVLTLPDGNLATLVFAQARDPQAAYAAAQQLNRIQIHNGRTANPDEPAGVRVAQIDAKQVNGKPQPAGIRAHYSHGDVVVRVDVKGKSLDSVTRDFNTVLAAELKVLAPDA